MKRVTPYPVIKIPGGKTKLIPNIISNLPEDFDETVKVFIEPFAGGLATSLYLATQKPKLKFRFNDYSFDIANLYSAIKTNPNLIIEHLNRMKLDLTEEGFYKARNTFNNLNRSNILDNGRTSYNNQCIGSSIFLFLNKTCYNGLVRFNSDGKFNSPHGRYKNPEIINEDNLYKLHIFLNDKRVLDSFVGSTVNNDFQKFLIDLLKKKKLKKDSFVYLDPPYIPLSYTASFSNYTYSGFGLYDQFRLKTTLEYLDHLGIRFLLSNSDTLLTKKLFGQFNMIPVTGKRAINCKSGKRGPIREYLIKNY